MDIKILQSHGRAAVEPEAKDRAVEESEWRRQFQEAFPADGRVLDVGAGSGRDLAALLELGYDAYGTEPAAAMRSKAVGLR